MLQNMAASVLLHKQIKTTEAKAKEARRLVERLITYGKKGTTHARRLAFAILRDKKATTILFDEVAPVYENRNGGYTRLIKLGYRPNDSAKVVLLQLVDFFSEEPKKDKKKPAEKKASKPAESKKTEVKSTTAEAKVDVTEEASASAQAPADKPVEETVETVEAEVVAEEVVEEVIPAEEAVEEIAEPVEDAKATDEKK